MLPIYFAYDSGNKLVISIERVADGLEYDFATGTFVKSPQTPTMPIAEGTGHHSGRYSARIDQTMINVFPDGDYIITVIDAVRMAADEPCVLGVLGQIMKGGDSAPWNPTALAVTLSGTVPAVVTVS